MQLTPEQEAEWQSWLAARPESVRAIATRLPPWGTYWLKNTGQCAAIQSYDVEQDGRITLTAYCWREWMPMFGHGVFGLDPDDFTTEALNGTD